MHLSLERIPDQLDEILSILNEDTFALSSHVWLMWNIALFYLDQRRERNYQLYVLWLGVPELYEHVKLIVCKVKL